MLIAQSCPTLFDSMDCSLSCSVHGILQARILEWVTISISRGSSWLRDQTWASWIADRFFTVWATREAPKRLKLFFYKGKQQALRTGFQFSSVSQSCLTLWDPMEYSTPGFPVHHQLPELAQTQVHWVNDAILPSHPLAFPFSSFLQPFPSSGSFPMSQLFTLDGQSIGASASASVLPVSIQDWFPLRWTALISLQSKGPSRVFYNTTLQKHQFCKAQLSLWSSSHIHI